MTAKNPSCGQDAPPRKSSRTAQSARQTQSGEAKSVAAAQEAARETQSRKSSARKLPAQKIPARKIPAALRRKLAALADKYETASFSDGDPSRVLRRYDAGTAGGRADTECAAFIAAMLAFGRREQFLAKTDFIFAEADKAGGPAAWLRSGEYRAVFGAKSPLARSGKKFYRFYSCADMCALFDRLREILREADTPGGFFRARYERACAAAAGGADACGADADGATACDAKARTAGEKPLLAEVVRAAFPDCKIVPQGADSANKRVNMFLRWMVRRDSPVDLGIWDWYSPAELVIPLDTHVLQEGIRLGLLPEKSPGTLKTARALTEAFRQIWRDDPCRGDFALFGLGVDTGSGMKNSGKGDAHKKAGA